MSTAGRIIKILNSGLDSNFGSTVLYCSSTEFAPWEISPEYSARRLLLIVMALRTTLFHSGTSHFLLFVSCSVNELFESFCAGGQ